MRDEAKNIGIILQCPNGGYVSGRFDEDLGRLAASTHDEIIINRYTAWLSHLSMPNGDRALFTERELDPEFLPRLAASASGNIQFTEPRGCVTADPSKTLDELFEMFVTSDEPGDTKSVLAIEKSKTFPRDFYAYLKSHEPQAALHVKPNRRVKIDQHNLSFDYGYERPGNRGMVLYETVDFSKGTFSSRVNVASPTIVKFGIVRNKLNRNRFKTYAVVKPLMNGHAGRDNEEMDLLKNSADDVYSFVDPVQMANLIAELAQDFAPKF